MKKLTFKQLLSVGIAGVLSPLLLSGMGAAAEGPAEEAQPEAQVYGPLDCDNQEILTWCFANTSDEDALEQCEDYISNTPDVDGCIGGSTVSSECGSSYWKIAAYVCP